MILAMLLFLSCAPPAHASTQPGAVVFSDSFTDGFSKWQMARGSQNMWTITNGVLQGEVMATNTVTELIPIPSLWSDNWRHYELELDLKPISGSDRNVAWGYQDANNWYEVHFLPTVFEFARRKNQSVAWYKSGNYQLTPNVWHHLKLVTVGGKLQLFINGTQVFEYLDTSYDGNVGTIALKVGTGVTAPSRVQFDNISVRLLADPRETVLQVPGFRQDDRTWADVEYDTASAWAGAEPADIQRWGCALTSATMLLRFYGFTQLLDGTPLTPLSLNSWLLAQSDGYVAEGWVNWLAIIRLSHLLRIEWSTPEKPLPQLRYSYQGWSNWETEGLPLIATEIAAGRPAILELPHHFIVANGVLGDGTLQITDPVSDKTKLSQGFSAPTSARLWHAQTGSEVADLSYWLIVFPRGLRIKLFTASGEAIVNWWLHQDLPGSFDSEFSPENWLAMTVPQPPAGEKFILEVAPAQGESFDGGVFPIDGDYKPYQQRAIQVYQYDAEANVITQQLKTNLGTQPQAWEIAGTATQPKLDWQNLIQELTKMEDYYFIAPLAGARLKQIAQFALTASQEPSSNQRYLIWFQNLLKDIVSFDINLLSDETRLYLETWLQQQLSPPRISHVLRDSNPVIPPVHLAV